MIILDQIPAADIDLFWPVLEPHYAASCERVATTLTPDLIKEYIRLKRWMGWAIYLKDKPVPIFAAAATSLRKTNKGLTSVIESIGGTDIDVWYGPILEEFERLARENGVVRIEIEGRRGWERKLPGFKMVRVIMERVLDEK